MNSSPDLMPFTISFALRAGCLLLFAICVFGVKPGHSARLSSPPVSSRISGTLTRESDNERSATDHKVYPKPPLPRLPRAGGRFIDPTFGAEIMRATDERDDKVGVSTFYSLWPTFNCDNTYI